MGANKNSDRRKCGDILINTKTIKNKAKGFTFHCSLCSMVCDQLKKFSKHLENHLLYFENNLENADEKILDQYLLFEPEEIKVEDMDAIDKSGCKAASGTTRLEDYDDPLETEKSYKSDLKKICNSDELMSTNIKNENNWNGEVENCENASSKMVCDSSASIAEAAGIEESKKNLKCPHPLILNDFSSDNCSDYSNDSDFDVKEELKITKKSGRPKDIKRKSHEEKSKRRKRSTKETNENNPDNGSNSSKPKRRRRVIIEKVLPILIQQYKKHKLLWQVDDIAFGVKNKKYEAYVQIAEVLKSEANEVISLDDINYHINYLNELYSKDKEQELKCNMEKKDFFPSYELYKEMSFLNSSQGPFLCTICNEVLPKYHPYCQHMAQHNDTQPFKCPSCEMLYTSYHKYLIHKKRHLGIHDFHCDICGKGYLFKNDLEWHVTSHTGDKPYLCQICGTGFRARHGYDNHVRRHEERFRHECHICKKGFNQLHALNSHVKSHLNIRDVICKICGKGFVHSKYLKRHELIHGKEKRYKCNECGKAFFQACGLRAHRKNHHS